APRCNAGRQLAASTAPAPHFTKRLLVNLSSVVILVVSFIAFLSEESIFNGPSSCRRARMRSARRNVFPPAALFGYLIKNEVSEHDAVVRIRHDGRALTRVGEHHEHGLKALILTDMAKQIGPCLIPQEKPKAHPISVLLVTQRDLFDARHLDFEHLARNCFGEHTVRLTAL